MAFLLSFGLLSIGCPDIPHLVNLVNLSTTMNTFSKQYFQVIYPGIIQISNKELSAAPQEGTKSRYFDK